MLSATEWSPVKVSELPTWPEHATVGFDVETYDPTLKKLGPGVRRDGYIVGYSFAIDGGPSYYVPMHHQGGGNVECASKAMQYLDDQVRRFRGTLVGANLGYDLDYLLQALGRPVSDIQRFRCWDVQVADSIIYELHDSYSLNSIAERRGIGSKAEDELVAAAEAAGVSAKGGLWQLHARHVHDYAVADAVLPLRIAAQQRAEIEDGGLEQIFDLECRLLPVLLKMRRRGVRVDEDKMTEIEEWAAKEAVAACDRLHELTGHRLDPASVMAPTKVAPILDAAGVKYGRTPKTDKPRIDKQLLESINNEVGHTILRARRMHKLSTTYVASLREHCVDGRVHPSFHQARNSAGRDREEGARFGRLASSCPNIQNQPARDPEIGKMWRAIYLPDEGGEWFSADFSAQEPRIVAHYAETVGLARAQEFAQAFRDDPQTDPYQTLADMIQLSRGETKTIYLGLSYGMGKAKLAYSLGLPTEMRQDARSGRWREVAGDEAESLFQRFHAGAPFISALSDKCRRKAAQRGYVKTLMGRKIHFPEKPSEYRRWSGDVYDWTQKALNRIIQGGAAEQMKQALVNLDAAGVYLQMQVHDEADGTQFDPSESEKVAEIMQESMKLRVPMTVEVKTGRHWGECK